MALNCSMKTVTYGRSKYPLWAFAANATHFLSESQASLANFCTFMCYSDLRQRRQTSSFQCMTQLWAPLFGCSSSLVQVYSSESPCSSMILHFDLILPDYSLARGCPALCMAHMRDLSSPKVISCEDQVLQQLEWLPFPSDAREAG